MKKFYIIYIALFLCALMSVPQQAAYAQDRDIVPKRTWAPNTGDEKPVRKFRPYNMKAILSGKQQQLQQSRSPLELAREGELPYSKALESTADTNQMRIALQMSEPFAHMNTRAIEKSAGNLKVKHKKNAYALLKKRNAFYKKKGLMDDYTQFEDKQEAKAKASAKLLAAGNKSAQSSLVRTKSSQTFIPAEVKLFMEETTRLSSLDPSKIKEKDLNTKNLGSSLTRQASSNNQAPNVRTGVSQHGPTSANVVVPKREPEGSVLKRVFPFFY